jgi:hypothetical protein
LFKVTMSPINDDKQVIVVVGEEGVVLEIEGEDDATLNVVLTPREAREVAAQLASFADTVEDDDDMVAFDASVEMGDA